MHSAVCFSCAGANNPQTVMHIQEGMDVPSSGAAMTFASSAHGAGRWLSRHQAIKFSANTDVREKLKKNGILAFSLSERALQEEIPEAYKDVDDVVEATVASGISRKVARLRPLLVIKG
jgi:tRNA-splicing ligase RtcB